MGKSWPIFLRLLALARLGQCQRPATTNVVVGDCGSKVYQDSLMARYLNRGAHRNSYLSPVASRFHTDADRLKNGLYKIFGRFRITLEKELLKFFVR